jgi:carbon storage regulator
MGSSVLVLRRRLGETILIGEVEIEVIEISRTRVKLGVRAPLHIPVIRKETLPIVRENQLASDLVASQGHDGVGKLARLLRQPELPANKANSAATEEDSTTQANHRYETPAKYSGYRDDRENPHPA